MTGLLLDTTGMTVNDIGRYLRARNNGDYETMIRVLQPHVVAKGRKPFGKEHWHAFYKILAAMETEIAEYLNQEFPESDLTEEEEQVVDGFLDVIRKAGGG